MTSDKSDKTLFLLFDGNALVHRAFHALPPLSIAKTGEMMNAVRGFAATLLKLLRENKPTYWAIAFDTPVPTFRHEKYAEYKKQRPPVPHELVNQLERVHQMAEAFNLPVFEIDGYEADDIIGTLSRQASEQGVDTLVVTGDNDMLQITSPLIKVMTPRRGFTDTVVYDEAGVLNKYGLGPKELIDFKALTGDPSDNITGVPGVGDKTAVKLLLQYKNLEGIYSHLDEVIPERIRNLLREYKEQAFQSRELVTIVTDAPVDLNLKNCKVSAYNRDKVVNLFRELEFAQLLATLPEELGSGVATPLVKKDQTGLYKIISSDDEFDSLIEQLVQSGEFAIDIKTSTANAMLSEIIGISITLKAENAFYIPVGHRVLSLAGQLNLAHVLTRFKPVLENSRLSKVMHNGKFGLAVLEGQGIKIQNMNFDTAIAAHLLGEKALTLKSLAFNKLGIEISPVEDLVGKGAKQVSIANLDIEKVAHFACIEVDMALRLKQTFEPELQNEGLWELFSKVEMPLGPVLVGMERAGVLIDAGLLKNMSDRFETDMSRLEKEIYSAVGHEFNINSPQQLSKILYDELHLMHSRKTKGGYSTDASVLEELKGTHPVIEIILQYRQVSKLKSTYTDAFLSLINSNTGRIHTSFNQTGTTTGRLSSSDPNLQNIPIRGELGSKLRQAIIAQPGWSLLSADYSQIDLRVLAHITQDPELLATFLRNEDVHTATASLVFNVPAKEVTSEMRRVAKTVNFGVIYGMSDYGLEQATSFSREEASKFIEAYFQKYTKVQEYIESTKQQARECGYVQTILGRRRFIPEIRSSNRQLREGAERMAINMPIQGTSADIIKIAMINIHREMDKQALKSKMTLQVHDELVFEVPPDEIEKMKRLITELMSKPLELSVPLKIDIKMGKNWGEME